MNKLPMVTAVFWCIKIVATTLGESVSNYVAITPLKLGYAVTAASPCSRWPCSRS